MFIKQFSVWRKIPSDNFSVWGGNKVVTAVTESFVIIRNEHVSQMFPETNKEEVILRSEFERDYVTKDEAARRIHVAADKILADLRAKHNPVSLRGATPAKAKLGEPALLSSDGYSYTYVASNGVKIRFDYMGHYKVESTGNPVSTFDAAWIAAKSAEIQKAYNARERRYDSYTFRSYYPY